MALAVSVIQDARALLEVGNCDSVMLSTTTNSSISKPTTSSSNFLAAPQPTEPLEWQQVSIFHLISRVICVPSLSR